MQLRFYTICQKIEAIIENYQLSIELYVIWQFLCPTLLSIDLCRRKVRKFGLKWYMSIINQLEVSKRWFLLFRRSWVCIYHIVFVLKPCLKHMHVTCPFTWYHPSLEVSFTYFSDFILHIECVSYFIGNRHTEVNSRLKLYCRYLYTRSCLINHIWGLKQLWLQVNGHAWFHLQRLRWPVRNGEGAKKSKWKYMSLAGFEPTPRQSTTGKLQRLRPLGNAG